MRTTTTYQKNSITTFTKVFTIAILMIIGLNANAQIPCNAAFTYTINPANNGQVTFTNTSTGTSGTTTYTWYFMGGSGGPTSNAQNPTYTYPASGSYVVCLRIIDSLTGAMCNDVVCDTLNVINGSTGVQEQATIASSLNNFPNPFHSNTTISYSLIQDAHIELAIFDILGKKVAHLETGEKTSGKHTIIWNVEAINQGLYIIQLKANNQTITKKIIITN